MRLSFPIEIDAIWASMLRSWCTCPCRPSSTVTLAPCWRRPSFRLSAPKSQRFLRFLRLRRPTIRQEKRAQRLTFWVRRPLGGVGVFHAEGWWPKTSCPPSKVCLPWVSKRGIWDVPGFLPGCPGPLALFKKFVPKNFVRVFRSLNEDPRNRAISERRESNAALRFKAAMESR